MRTLLSVVLICSFSVPPNTMGDAPIPAASPFKALPGFAVETVYQVPKKEMGSWVAMTFDDKGRLLAADQSKPGIFRLNFAADGSVAKVDTICPQLGAAQGLCWAFDSLYVVVSHDVGATKQGVYRAQDSNGDGTLDKITPLLTMVGGGEHGPHGVIAGPDGKIYVTNGNHTNFPELAHSVVPRNWQEDHLLPRMWDARGHAKGKLAPGGFIVRMDPDGGNSTLISTGYRNQYDIAFNANGDLFTYDADMEWDIGAPWYRPTRINHVISGSEFGWRAGTGKWPDYTPDSYGSVLDVGQGSPTGICFGYGAAYPAEFQRALFLADWSYGKLYALHLAPAGSTYVGKKEVVVSGTPMPITDLEISPVDHMIYFVVGGRNADSVVYRVRYTGTASTAKVSYTVDLPPEAGLRRDLEAWHGSAKEGAVAAAWPYLGHPDRGVRFAARIAIEHQPVGQWAARALAEREPAALIQAAVALARNGKPEHQAPLLAAMRGIDWQALAAEQRLGLARAMQLTFTRLGQPAEADRAAAIAWLAPIYPAEDSMLNRELSQLAIYLEAPWAAKRTVDLMLDPASSNQDQIQYALNLRVLKGGWNLDLQKGYFAWFNRAIGFGGGMSFKGFIKNIKADAIASQQAANNPALTDVLKEKAVDNPLASMVAPKGPGKAWTIAELAEIAKTSLKGRDFDNGRRMFAAGMCIACHGFNGTGGAVGPDLSGVGGRFSPRDILETIIEPSAVISDQYQPTVFTMKDGKTITGRIINVFGDSVSVSTNIFDPSVLAKLKLDDIASQAPSTVSEMPPGLIFAMNSDEIMDLLAYLISAGDRTNAVFAK